MVLFIFIVVIGVFPVSLPSLTQVNKSVLLHPNTKLIVFFFFPRKEK